MSEQESFEKFMSDKGYAVSYIGDGQYEFQSTQLNWQIWQAATAEANKRIAELEGEVAELKDFFAKKYVPNKDISILEKDIKELKEIASYHNTHCSEVNARVTELQASNNRLREKLENALTSLEESQEKECRCYYTR